MIEKNYFVSHCMPILKHCLGQGLVSEFQQIFGIKTLCVKRNLTHYFERLNFQLQKLYEEDGCEGIFLNEYTEMKRNCA